MPASAPPQPSSASPQPRPPTSGAATGRPGLGRWLLLLVVVATAVLLDQASKNWVQHELAGGSRQSRVMGQWGGLSASLILVRNRGAAWGLFSQLDDAYRRPFLVAVTSLAMGFVLFLFARTEPGHRLVLLALALVMGGAIGNLIDRVRFGSVIDFIDVRAGSFRWPTFNVADIAITVGVALMLLEMRPRRQRKTD